MVFDDKQNLKAVLPANRVEDTVYSHQGLTYGGLVLPKKVKTEAVFNILDTIVGFLKKHEISTLLVKQLPAFYTKVNADEFDCYVFQNEGNIIRKDMNLAFPLFVEELLSKSKFKHYKKSEKFDFKIVENSDFQGFWDKVLIPRLAEKHQAKPVHTLKEIEYLGNKFPENIKQYNVYYQGEIVAGITTFETNFVVKSQYGATTQLGEKVRALDFLYFELFKKYRHLGKHFFDMGVVTDTSFEFNYNSGLLQQKEELGGVVYSQNFLELKVK